MNIIAGEKRGTKLFAPEGMDTRPTQAMVKGSLFNIIQRELPGARVLDLFAGSGALSLEALSRGAKDAVLCDASRVATGIIQRNIQKLRYEERVRLFCRDWKKLLDSLDAGQAGFTLVFLDPPYRMQLLEECTTLLNRRRLLAEDALLVYEHQKGIPLVLDENFEALRSKQYGDTEIHFFRYHLPKNKETAL